MTVEGALTASRKLHLYALEGMNPPIKVGSREEYLFLSGAFGGEAGELQNEIKKVARDGMTPERLKKISDEVGDVLAYLVHICDVFEINSAAAFKNKTAEVIWDRGREWTGGLYDHIQQNPHDYAALFEKEEDNGQN